MGVLEERQVADGEWRREVDRRLDEDMERLDRHEQRLEEGEARMSELMDLMRKNNEMTERIDKSTSGVVKASKAVDGFLTVSSWIGNAVKWIAVLLLSLGVLIWAMRSGELPRTGDNSPSAHASVRP